MDRNTMLALGAVGVVGFLVWQQRTQGQVADFVPVVPDFTGGGLNPWNTSEGGDTSTGEDGTTYDPDSGYAPGYAPGDPAGSYL